MKTRLRPARVQLFAAKQTRPLVVCSDPCARRDAEQPQLRTMMCPHPLSMNGLGLKHVPGVLTDLLASVLVDLRGGRGCGAGMGAHRALCEK